MGTFLRATCKKCDFNSGRIIFGAGERTFETNCAVPGIDLNTNKLVVENWKNRGQLRGKILFYTERELYKGEIIEDIDNIDWGFDSINFGSAVLKKADNKCPQCNNFSMQFEEEGKFR